MDKKTKKAEKEEHEALLDEEKAEKLEDKSIRLLKDAEKLEGVYVHHHITHKAGCSCKHCKALVTA